MWCFGTVGSGSWLYDPMKRLYHATVGPYHSRSYALPLYPMVLRQFAVSPYDSTTGSPYDIPTVPSIVYLSVVCEHTSAKDSRPYEPPRVVLHL